MKKITRTVTVYVTKTDSVELVHYTMESAMKAIKDGASYVGEKTVRQEMSIEKWNENATICEIEK